MPKNFLYYPWVKEGKVEVTEEFFDSYKKYVESFIGIKKYRKTCRIPGYMWQSCDQCCVDCKFYICKELAYESFDNVVSCDFDFIHEIEADDIIARFSKELTENERVLLISLLQNESLGSISKRTGEPCSTLSSRKSALKCKFRQFFGII